MKTLGILGGVGPETTAKFYLRIEDLFRGTKLKNHPPVNICNLTYPFSLEWDMIALGKNSEKMTPIMVHAVKTLEKSGCDFIVLPCNTLHKHLETIRLKTKIPILSIIEETLKVIKKRNITKVGILASQTTVKSGLFSIILTKNHIEVLNPNKNQQSTINKIICQLIAGKNSENQKKKLETISESLLSKGAEVILLACTDLQLVLEDSDLLPIIDTMEVLAQAAFREMKK